MGVIMAISELLNLPDSVSSLSPFAFAVMAAGLFFASLARGYSGFGFSAVLISSWSLIGDPARAVGVALLLEVTASLIQAFSVWRDIPWRRVWFLLAGAAIGTGPGVYLLSNVPSSILKVALSVFLLVAALLLLKGWKLRKRANDAGSLAVGIASGVANGAVGMGGLPVALFLTADGDTPAKIRASVTAYFFLLDIMGLAFLRNAGLVDQGNVALALWSFPVLVVGMTLGTRHFLGATPESFRRITLFMLMAIAAAGLIRHFLG